MYGNNNNKTCPASKEERKSSLVLQTVGGHFSKVQGQDPSLLTAFPLRVPAGGSPQSRRDPCSRRVLFLPLTKPGGRGRVLRATDPSQGHQGETRHWQCGATPPRSIVAKRGGDTKAASRQRRGCWHPFVLAQGEKLGRAHLWSSVCTNENVRHEVCINLFCVYNITSSNEITSVKIISYLKEYMFFKQEKAFFFFLEYCLPESFQ